MGQERRCRVQNKPWGVLYKTPKGHQIWLQGGPTFSPSACPPSCSKNEFKSMEKCEALQRCPPWIKKVQPGLKMTLTCSSERGEKDVRFEYLGALWRPNYCTKFIQGVNERVQGDSPISLQRTSFESKLHTLYWAYRRHLCGYFDISVVFLDPF